MITTEDALYDGDWEEERDVLGNVSLYTQHLTKNIEICLEPLLQDDQFYLAVYKDKSLMFPKVVMKPGFIEG